MAYMDQEPLRILLIGRTGDGKSSTGNTILGRDYFVTSSFSTSQTKESQLKRSEWHGQGRYVEVVDTPGMFDTENGHSHLPVLKELIRALLITTPGFHVIAFVLKPGKFTPEVQNTLDTFFKWFGQGVEKHAFVILTHTDSDDKMEKYLNTNPHTMLTTLVTNCCHRVVCLDNNGSEEIKKSQLGKLFEMVDQIIAKNNGQYFTNAVYKLAQIYADNLEGRNISKDSISILRSAGLPWPKAYLGEAENAFSSIISYVEENVSTTTTQLRGNLTIIDENDIRLPNTVPQDISSDISTSGTIVTHNDEVGGRSGRVDFGPATSEYNDLTLHSMHVPGDDGSGFPSLSDTTQSTQSPDANVDTDNGYTDIDDRYMRRRGQIEDQNRVLENASENNTDNRSSLRSDRRIDIDSVCVNVSVGDSSDGNVSRSRRNVDLNSVQVNVPVSDNDRSSLISQGRNAATSNTTDPYGQFRQNANNNVSWTTKFSRYVQNLRHKMCTIL